MSGLSGCPGPIHFFHACPAISRNLGFVSHLIRRCDRIAGRLTNQFSRSAGDSRKSRRGPGCRALWRSGNAASVGFCTTATPPLVRSPSLVRYPQASR
jgi:hypothetical protein